MSPRTGQVGGERAPLPRMWPSPRPEPLWGVCLCHLRARAAVPLCGAPSVGACRVPWGGGGGLPLSLHSPLPAAGGLWLGWPVGGNLFF